MDSDRDLLFAVLALQNGLLTRDQFVAACSLRAARTDTPLHEILMRKGWLAAEDRSAVIALMARALGRTGGNARDAIAKLQASDVRATLQRVGELGQSAVLPDDNAMIPIASSAEEAPRYTISRLHATGGIGQVWLAADSVFGREVALKDLKPARAANPAVWPRFLREARITGQLQHPGIVPVYEIGTKPGGGEPFYTMRFVRGRTLAEAIQHYHRSHSTRGSKTLELRDLLAAFVGICHAIAYAHDRGVLHRDLKPQNILLGDYGEVVVLDWGLARLFETPQDEANGSSVATIDVPVTDSGDPVATSDGDVLGTPAYMAPEQAAGKIDELTPVTDVYGLGAILYEILTSRPPFPGKTTESVLRDVRETTPAAPHTLVSDTPRALESICLKALQKKPADRYRSAKKLAEDVRCYLADEPVSAHRDGPLAKLGRWSRRHKPAVAALVATILVLTATGTVLGVRHVRERDRVQHETALSEEAARREAEHRAAEADRRHAVGLTAARAGDLDRAVASLAEAVGYCEGNEALAAKRRQASADLRAVERFRAFRIHSAAALRTGVHNVRSRDKDDDILKHCDAALAVYDITTKSDWLAGVENTVLTPAQVAEVKSSAHELLILAALRLAMFDTRNDEGKANTRRALALLDRAAELRTPGGGVWMMRMLWNRRIGNGAAADHAGKIAAELAQTKRFDTALDNYLLGSIALHVLKQPKEAIDFYLAAISHEPNHFGANYGLYVCYVETKDLRARLSPLTTCLALQPNEPDLFFQRGFTYFELGEYQRAYDDFDASVTRDPTYKSGYYFRGRVHFLVDRWAEAERDFAKALELEPYNNHWRAWHALALAKLDRHKDAAAAAEKAVAAEPRDATTLFYTARAYAQCVRAVRETEAGPLREPLLEKYGKRSVELLRRSAANGFKDFSRIQSPGDFDPIQARPDFQKLLKELGIPAERPAKEKKLVDKD